MARALHSGFRLAALVAVLGGPPGCGNPTAVVRGTVTVDGVPASDGSVNFEPADGQGPSTGAKVTDGRYEVPAAAGLTPGKKKVTVRASVKTGKQIAAGPPAPPGTIMDELKFHPAHGVQPDVREVDVAAGNNEQAFDLTMKPAGKK